MRVGTIAVVTVLALSGTVAFAQSNSPGGGKTSTGAPMNGKTTTDGNTGPTMMNGSTTTRGNVGSGSSQAAPTDGSIGKAGSTSPGVTVKK
jgi:hypothetical protein